MASQNITPQTRILPLETRHIPAVARLHMRSMPESLPSKFGLEFLSSLYENVKNDPVTTSFIAVTETGTVVGIITATKDLDHSIHVQQKQLLTPKMLTRTIFMYLTGVVKLSETIRRVQFELYMTGLENPYATILTLAVDPAVRRKGIGTQLIQRVITYYKKEHVVLHVDTKSNNIKALSLYKKLGFVPIAAHSGNTILTTK